MAKIGLPKGSRKRLKVREKSVKSQGILKWMLSGNTEAISLPTYKVFLKKDLILKIMFISVPKWQTLLWLQTRVAGIFHHT